MVLDTSWANGIMLYSREENYLIFLDFSIYYFQVWTDIFQNNNNQSGCKNELI